MQEVSETGINQLSTESVETLIHETLKLPQVSCGISHIFGPTIYIKEAHVPAGTYAIGQIHRFPCTNVLIKGRVSVINADKSITEFVAPMTFVSQPGRKVGYFHEDTIWQNIYATNERDLEKLDKLLLIQNEELLEINNKKVNDKTYIENCRSDYKQLLAERGLTEEQAKEIVEDHSDLIPFPYGTYKFTISDSEISGKGLFATNDIAEGEVIAPARIGLYRTPAGRYTNHSMNPNSYPVRNNNGSIDLVASRFIKGSSGGILGDEITVNYRQASIEAGLLDKDM